MAEQTTHHEVNRAQSVSAPSPTDVPATTALDSAARAAGESQITAVSYPDSHHVSLPAGEKESQDGKGSTTPAAIAEELEEARETNVREPAAHTQIDTR